MKRTFLLLFSLIIFNGIFAQLKMRETGQLLFGEPMTYWSGGVHPLDKDTTVNMIIYGRYGDWRIILIGCVL